MQTKILVVVIVGLILAVSVLSVAFVWFYLSTTQREKVPLAYEGQMIMIENSTYATMAVNFKVDKGVRYDCVATVTYTATNGSQVQITKELGLLSVSTNGMGTGFQLMEYSSENPFLVSFSNNNPLPNVHIDAYGYTKP
ncbi:MAG: hypothetical protein ACM3UY_04820 [Methanocella sp.]